MQHESSDHPDLATALSELSAAEAGARAETAFGARVREARQIAGMTQRQLADTVGLDASAISRLEQGYRAIRLGEATLIAHALKRDLRQLVYGDLVDDPRLELYAAFDELEHAAAQVRDATRAAEFGIEQIKTVLGTSDVREYLSASPVDVDNVINMCSYVLNRLYEDDHPYLLRKISSELVEMDQVHINLGTEDGPDT